MYFFLLIYFESSDLSIHTSIELRCGDDISI